MKIYTKTGDDGTTALFDGTRVKKSNERVDLYGEVDELNSCLGIAASFVNLDTFKKTLQDIQRDLFALGAHLANPMDKKQNEKSDFNESKVIFLETQIDQMESLLTPMKNFILPGGVSSSSFLHLARTICRRVERKLVHFSIQEILPDLYLRYLNRLSDYLFVAARYANYIEGKNDIPW